MNVIEYNSTASVRTRLDEVPYFKVIDTNPGFGDTRGSAGPTEFTIFQGTNTTLQIIYLGIPSTGETGTVIIRYYNLPVDMASDSDEPFDNKVHLRRFHNAIAYHTTARIKAIESKTDEASFYFGLYNQLIQNAITQLAMPPHYIPIPINPLPQGQQKQ